MRLHLGSDWKLLLGVVFVALVVFLRHGVIGGVKDLAALAVGAVRSRERRRIRPESRPPPASELAHAGRAPQRPRRPAAPAPILETRKAYKRYGGLLANRDIDFA